MAYEVIFTVRAEQDLVSIANYLSESIGRVEARRIAGELAQAAQRLTTFPTRGQKIVDFNVRKLSQRPYLIYYRIIEPTQTVRVLRFWHGARDPRSLRLPP